MLQKFKTPEKEGRWKQEKEAAKGTPTHNKKRLVITFNAGFLKRPSSGDSLIYLTTENKENRPNQGRGEEQQQGSSKGNTKKPRQ